MNITIPIPLVRGCTLDTKVKDCITSIPLPYSISVSKCDEYDLPEINFPRNFENSYYGDIVLLGHPVCALTSRDYLEKVNEQLTLAALFQEEGDFFPYNPKYVPN